MLSCSEMEETPLIELESHFFRDLLGRLEDPVFVKNNRHQWIFANQAFKELVDCEDLIGKTDADLLPADQVEQFYEGDNQVIRTQTSLTQEEEIGEGCYALVKKVPIKLPDGTIGLFGIIFDISEYRKVQLEVAKLRIAKVQSHTDSLTGLANRRHLEKYFSQLLEKNQSNQNTIGLLHIDLDHFKEINDTKGHLFGDDVLTHISTILRSSVKADDFIARIGGDEFVIVTYGISQSILENAAQRIVTAVNKPVLLDNESCFLTVSVGVASDSTGSQTLNQMLKFADLALYRAKNNGRGRYEPFTSRIQQEHDKHRQRRDEFRIGIDKQQFVPFYQPQFDTDTLEIIGVEALARWNHPNRGFLLPGDFLELAVSEKRMVDLDRMIFRAAMRDAKTLENMGCPMPGLSINVSPQSLVSSDFIDIVKEKIPTSLRLCFELVESMLLDEPNSVVTENIEKLRELGVTLDVDDFGSGHTSLLGVLEVKPDRIKIDKRLVIPMTESAKHHNLVKSIIQIADSLGIDTIAEGVESEHHREVLRELGCTFIQGFGFARPMSFHDLQLLIQPRSAA